jgi:shikimate dehydrogenase
LVAEPTLRLARGVCAGGGTGARDRYAVIGNPVSHSKSPFIHARFAEQTGEPIEYTHLLGTDRCVRAACARVHGSRRPRLNVTVPFKLDAHALATTLSPRAAAAGAVNTLRFDADGIYGDNTDGFGLVRDVEVNLVTPLKGARMLLLGAGGAARGVVLPMLERAPHTLTIVNRTAGKAQCAGRPVQRGRTRGRLPFLAGGNADSHRAGCLRRHHQCNRRQSRCRAARVATTARSAAARSPTT